MQISLSQARSSSIPIDSNGVAPYQLKLRSRRGADPPNPSQKIRRRYVRYPLLADVEILVASRGARIEHADLLEIDPAQDIATLDGRALAVHGSSAHQVAHAPWRVIGRPAFLRTLLGRSLGGTHRSGHDRRVCSRAAAHPASTRPQASPAMHRWMILIAPTSSHGTVALSSRRPIAE